MLFFQTNFKIKLKSNEIDSAHVISIHTTVDLLMPLKQILLNEAHVTLATLEWPFTYRNKYKIIPQTLAIGLNSLR